MRSCGMRAVAVASMLGLLVAATASAAPAADDAGTAPARTVEGAQEFLRQVLPGSRYVSTPMAEMLAGARREQLRGSYEPLPLVIDADPVAACVSRLRADVSATWLVLRNPMDAWDASEAPVQDLLGSAVVGDPDGIHFGSIRALRQSGSQVHLRFAGNSDDAVLHLDAEETAQRVYAAFDFLRKACDATRDTGF